VLVLGDPRSRGETFNLTYGESRSIAELASIVQQHFPGTEVEHVQRDALMPVRGTLSVAKARELLGYAPENPLDVGIGKYVASLAAGRISGTRSSPPNARASGRGGAADGTAQGNRGTTAMCDQPRSSRRW
jgi:hypothetical protein